MEAREGDLIENQAGLIFDVKGLIHPPDKTVAFPRFVPDPAGNRTRKGITYSKIYALSERYQLLESRFPKYLVHDPVFGERLSEVPEQEIRRHYDPIDRLRELRGDKQLDQLEARAVALVEFLQRHSDVPEKNLGISGSLLCRLHTAESDIDPIVYGQENALRLYETLRAAKGSDESSMKAYTVDELKTLFDFRSRDTKVSFKDFLTTERRKILQGRFCGHDYFIRCLKDWDEIEEGYGDVVFRKVGYARIKATVVDASETLFTPCRYSLDEVRVLQGQLPAEVTEIVSFRGRFCEQAEQGEVVIAQGKVEKAEKAEGSTFYRLLLGNNPSDFMLLAR
jgi:predicted nucleotidyltransferase